MACRKNCHDTVRVTNRRTRKTEVKPGDAHMTVYMGADQDHCHVQGHIYLVQGRDGIPTAIAKPGDRKIVQQGYEPVGVELWDTNGHGGGTTASVFAQWQNAGNRTKQQQNTYKVSRGATYHREKTADVLKSSWRRNENDQSSGGSAMDNLIMPAKKGQRKPSSLGN